MSLMWNASSSWKLENEMSWKPGRRNTTITSCAFWKGIVEKSVSGVQKFYNVTKLASKFIICHILGFIVRCTTKSSHWVYC